MSFYCEIYDEFRRISAFRFAEQTLAIDCILSVPIFIMFYFWSSFKNWQTVSNCLTFRPSSNCRITSLSLGDLGCQVVQLHQQWHRDHRDGTNRHQIILRMSEPPRRRFGNDRLRRPWLPIRMVSFWMRWHYGTPWGTMVLSRMYEKI